MSPKSRDPLADALRVSHNTLRAFDGTSIGRASTVDLLDWIGRLSGALVLLTQTVEETPILIGRSAPESPTSTMWPAEAPGGLLRLDPEKTARESGPSGGTEAGR
ncbi:hypothetical protein [Actinomadura sp. HBU206391]|uniref:hypothetical protein n=1 Tax=Actinomadura sp. HBU206391 TaxID=2731692 RepID=UPI00164EE6EF|nr:hypothetical protein [Actinomadura sp. HBU206391]MBC6458453.1 hypothetical protein [Actinomadura sp. HBU206391]